MHGYVFTHLGTAAGYQPQASVTLKDQWLRAAFQNQQSHLKKCHRARGLGESPSAPALQQAGSTPSFTHAFVQPLLKEDFTAPRDSPCWCFTAKTDDHTMGYLVPGGIYR